MDDANGSDPLIAVVNALKPLKSDERLRTVEAALHYLGEAPLNAADTHSPGENNRNGGNAAETPAHVADYPAQVQPWLKQHDVSTDELDQVFHFADDGTFAIHDVPGSSAKEKSLNVYILTGLGTFLATGKRAFADDAARQYCQTLGCYDAANHATHLKNFKGAEFTGDKKKGFSITNPGIKKGAALVKELAAETKK